MPGVSSRQPVKGADGFGKVHFKFMPKPPPRGHRVLGFFVYGVFFGTLILSFAWSRPYLKYNYAVPGLRKILSYVDRLKQYVSGAPEQRSSPMYNVNDITEIHAKSIEGAMFDQGYMHATDRLMQMEILRRTALGTLAEYYGSGSVDSDKFFRTLNIRDIAHRDVQALTEAEMQYLTYYSAGVNAYVAAASRGDYGGSVPLDFDLLLGAGKYTFQPWEPAHTMAILRLLAYQWSHGWEDELLSLLVSKTAEVPESSLWFAGKRVAEQSANAIPTLGGVTVAVSGGRSASKGSLLANSFVTSATHSGLWYFNALNVPQALRVSGASVPGVPFVFVGRNNHISWGISRAANPESEKLFFQQASGFTTSPTSDTASPATSSSDNSRDIALREELIAVRGQAEPVQHTARDTVHGPVVSDHLSGTIGGSIAQLELGWQSFTLSSHALQQPLSLFFLHKINTAADFEQFASGAEDLAAIALNFVYADANGNIGSVVNGRFPPQVEHLDTAATVEDLAALSGASSVEGDEPAGITQETAAEVEIAAVSAVTEVVPETLSVAPAVTSVSQRVYNPPSGMLMSQTSLSQAGRICQRLHCDTASAIVRAVDLESLLIDTFSPSSLVLRDIILQVPVLTTLSAAEHAEVLAIQALVAGFDGLYSTHAGAPVLLEAFRVALVQRVLRPVVGVAAGAVDAAMYPTQRVKGHSIRSEIQWIYDTLLKPDATCLVSTFAESSDVCAFRAAWWRNRRTKPDELVLDALRDAVEWCKGTYGASTAKWAWGDAHVVQYAHPNPKWIPIVDELLTRGPAGMSGTLDSLQRSDYVAPSGLLTTSVLHHTENTAATSLRVVFDMANKRCYRGMTALPQSLRLGSLLAGAVQHLTRWAQGDLFEDRYDEICWRNVAPKINKDEL